MTTSPHLSRAYSRPRCPAWSVRHRLRRYGSPFGPRVTTAPGRPCPTGWVPTRLLKAGGCLRASNGAGRRPPSRSPELSTAVVAGRERRGSGRPRGKSGEFGAGGRQAVPGACGQLDFVPGWPEADHPPKCMTEGSRRLAGNPGEQSASLDCLEKRQKQEGGGDVDGANRLGPSELPGPQKHCACRWNASARRMSGRG